MNKKALSRVGFIIGLLLLLLGGIVAVKQVIAFTVSNNILTEEDSHAQVNVTYSCWNPPKVTIGNKQHYNCSYDIDLLNKDGVQRTINFGSLFTNTLKQSSVYEKVETTILVNGSTNVTNVTLSDVSGSISYSLYNGSHAYYGALTINATKSKHYQLNLLLNETEGREGKFDILLWLGSLVNPAWSMYIDPTWNSTKNYSRWKLEDNFIDSGNLTITNNLTCNSVTFSNATVNVGNYSALQNAGTDYCHVNDTNMGGALGDFAMAGWFYLTSTSPASFLMCNGGWNGASPYNRVCILQSGGTLYISDVGSADYSTTFTIGTGGWTHLTFGRNTSVSNIWYLIENVTLPGERRHERDFTTSLDGNNDLSFGTNHAGGEGLSAFYDNLYAVPYTPTGTEFAAFVSRDNDTEASEAVNVPPAVATAAINVSTAYRYDNLNCSATPTDATNTSILVNFSWYKGGALQFVAQSSCANNTQCFSSRLMPSVNKSEVYICGANAFDGTDWSNETNSSSLTISNTAPSVGAIAFLNASTFINTSLAANSTYTDLDADSGTVYFNWTVNGILKRQAIYLTQANGTTVTDTFTTGNYTRNDVIQVNVSSADGTTGSSIQTLSRTVLNYAPIHNTVAINASTAYRYDNLNCSATGIDSENSTLFTNFSWYKGGVLQFIANSTCANNTQCFTSRLMPSINKSEVYVCGVNVFDGDAWSNETNSSSLTVSNTVPVLSGAIFANTSVYFNTSLTANITYTDIDADVGTVYFNWTINGNTTLKRAVSSASINNGTFVADTITAFNFTSADNITINFSANDGTIGSNLINLTINVSNYIPPIISTINIYNRTGNNVSILNSSVYTDASFNCTVTYDDFENTTGYVQFSWFNNGALVDEYSTNVTAADQGTAYSYRIQPSETTKNDLFTCRVRACDNFNSTSCSGFTNSTVSIINAVPVIQQLNITNYKTLAGTNVTVTIRALDIDGAADLDRYEVWFNSSNYTNTQFSNSGNNTVASINISISPYFNHGNYSINVTLFDDTGQHRINPPNINGNNQIEIYPGISRTDPNISKQITQSLYLGKNIIPSISYSRQLALTNPFSTAIPISGNTTLSSTTYVVNSTLSLINQTSTALNHTGMNDSGFINFTEVVPPNSTLILNLTYNLTPMVISNITSVCTLTDCDVNFTIENRHVFKIDDVDLIIQDVDLPHWNDRSIIQTFFNLVNGTGAGQYERRTVSVVNSDYVYNNSNYSVNICTGLCTQDDPTLNLIALTGDNGNTTNSTGTDATTTSSDNEVAFSLGSLKVDNIDLGASSTYVLRVRYSYSTAESSSSGGGGGGGTGAVIAADLPLLLSAGAFNITVKTDKGGSRYQFYAEAGEERIKPLIVKNTGKIDADVGISCEEISQGTCGWVKFDKSSIKLKPNEEIQINMSVIPSTTANSGSYKYNVFVFNNQYKLGGRLPVTVSVSFFGKFFNYFDNLSKPLISIKGNKDNGGKDINIPAYLISIMTLVGGIPLLWFLLLKIAPKTSSTAGWIATGVSFMVAAILPLLT